MIKDEKPGEEQSQRVIKSSLLSVSSGSPDGSEQHVGVMNATFSAPCSLVPIDSCHLGAHNPVFLQQASCVTGGVYVKSQHVSFVNHRPSISFAPVVAVQWRICSISAASQQQQCNRQEERDKKSLEEDKMLESCSFGGSGEEAFVPSETEKLNPIQGEESSSRGQTREDLKQIPGASAKHEQGTFLLVGNHHLFYL
ncbi:hypothetical protein POTOM_044637 [Populus tomentosa]|uniref:General transcription and DNA repair factor IIH subunit TFB4 n=1 Tax=Populus tomentosa TaxID=118781 RepID=A0A8X7YWN6_POPTO|nr:hypothetical protein POTOM_044637 [Populus tomentosa]